MVKVLMSSLLIVFSMVILNGQDVDERLNNNFKKYSIFDVEISNLAEQSFRKDGNTKLRIPSPYGNGLIELELFKSDILAEQYALLISDGKSMLRKDRTDILPMKGLITGRPETRVNAVVADNYFFASIDDGSDIYFYEPVSLYGAAIGTSQVVMYKSADVKPTAGTCGSKVLNEKLKERNPSNSRLAGECFEVEYAVASDFRMYQDFGNSVGQVEAFVISITDLMNTNYETDFNDELQHILVQQVISTSANGDVWLVGGSPGSIDELLDEFTAWGPGGFTAEHDLGSLWTGYNLSGSVVGLAWVGVVCRSFRYNVLEHYSTNMNSLRVLVSHEVGHNYNAVHDLGSGFIMSPSVNNTNTWSQESKDVINAYYEPQKSSCFDNCGGGGPGGGVPTANFEYEITESCAIGQVNFTDTSTDNPTSWAWSFQGGSPSTSTSPNPVVNYNQAGVYDVTLTVSNSNGSDNITRNNIIVIEGLPTAFFSFQVNGSSVSFFNQSVGAASYFWNFGDATTSSQSNPQKTYNQPGTYNVSLTSTNSCGSDEVTISIVIDSPVSADFEVNNNNICAGESVIFNDLSTGNPTSWSWEFEGGNPATSELQNPVVQYESPGSYDVRLIVSNGSGSDQKTMNNFIQVGEVPIADFTFQVSGPTVTFNNTSINANNYVWRFGDGLASTQENPQHTYEEPGTYSVELSALNDCNSDMITQNIIIVTNPIARFSFEGDGSLCIGESIRFFQNSSGNPTSFSWVFEGGTPTTSEDPNPAVTFNERGTFDVTLTVSNDAGSDQITLTDIINVNTPPTADFDYLLTAGMASFNNLSVGAENIEWDFGDGNTSSENNPVHEYQENGNYTVSITIDNECGTDIFMQQLNVVLIPVADFETDGPSTICAGESVTFNDLSTGNPTSWSWEFEGGNPATSELQNPIVQYESPGSYDVRLIVSNGSGSDQKAINNFIQVGELPVAGFTFEISGPTVTFNNTSVSADNYVWRFGDGLASTQENPQHTYEESGIYSVELSALNDCNSDVITQNIEIILHPIADFSFEGDGTICSGESIQFLQNSMGNPTSFSWVFEGGIPATSEEANPTVTFNESGTFDVTLSVSNDAGSDQITMSGIINVNDPPTADFDYLLMAGMASFNNLSVGAENIEWDFGDGNTSSENNPVHEYQENGNYTVSITIDNECGTDIFMQELNVVLAPVADFEIDGPSTICTGETISFEDASINEPSTWYWEFEGGNPSTSNLNNPQVSYPESGVFGVSLIVSNNSGSDTIIMEEVIVVKPDPVSSFTAEVLEGGLVQFSNTSTDATSYHWDFGDGSSSSDQSPSKTYEEEGIYEVVLTATNDCEVNISSQSINTFQLPVTAFSVEADLACIGVPLRLINNSSGADLTFSWQFPGGSPSSSSEIEPTISYNEPGVYTITLISSNLAGADTMIIDNAVVVRDYPESNVDWVVDSKSITTSNNSTGDGNHIWDFGDGTTSTEISPDHTYDREGIYTITHMVSNICGADTTVGEVNLFTIPQAQFSVSIVEGCVPLKVALENTSSSNSTGFQWVIEGGEPSSSNDQSPVINFENPGEYSITLIVSNPAGSDTLTIDNAVSAFGIPKEGIVTTLDLLDVNFSPVDPGAESYSWDFGDGVSSSDTSPGHTYNSEGTYTVVMEATNECGSSTTSIELIVNELPSAGFVADTTTTCQEGTIQFEQISSSNVQSFNWYFEGGSPSISADPNPTVAYSEAGLYDVMLIVTGVAGADTLIIEDYVEVKTVPDIQSSVEVDGNIISIVNLTPDALLSIFTVGDEMFNGDSLYFTASQNGIFEIGLEVSNACGSSSASFSEEVNVYPEALLSFTSAKLCIGDPFMLSSVRKIEEDVYQWYISNVDTTIVLTGSEAVLQVEKADVYDLLLTVSNQYGIDSLFLEEAIVVEGPIVADFTVELNDNKVSGSIDNISGGAYNWDMGDGTTYSGDSIFHAYQEDGVYLVQVIASNSCGQDTASLVLEALASGVDGPEWGQGLVVYPNPVKTDLNISIKGSNEPLKVDIRDMNGRSIKSFDLKIGINAYKIDINELPPAVYIMSMSDGIRVIHRKFIKVD